MLQPFEFVSGLLIYALNLAEGSLVTTTATAAAAITTIATRVSLVDAESPTVELLTVESGQSRHGFRFGRHLNKPETARLTAKPIHDHSCTRHFAILRKCLPE